MTSNPKNIRELRDEPGISHLDALDARSVEIHQLMCEYLDGDLTLPELLDSVEAVIEFGSKQPQLPIGAGRRPPAGGSDSQTSPWDL